MRSPDWLDEQRDHFLRALRTRARHIPFRLRSSGEMRTSRPCSRSADFTKIKRFDFGALRSAIRARQFNDAGLHEQHHPRHNFKPADAANDEH